MMIVNMNPRHSNVHVSAKSFVLGEQKQTENFIQQLESEVRSNPNKAKELLKQLIKTRTTLSSILVLAPTTNVIPPDLKNGLLIAIGVLAFLGVTIAVICLILSGMWKILMGKKADSDDWTVSIYKGLLQVILAPVTVALIVALCCLLFGQLPAFQPIKDPITTLFHIG